MEQTASRARPETTPRGALLRGAFFLALAAVSWTLGVVDGDLTPIRVVLASALTLFGLIRIGSGVVMLLRRRERHDV